MRRAAIRQARNRSFVSIVITSDNYQFLASDYASPTREA